MAKTFFLGFRTESICKTWNKICKELSGTNFETVQCFIKWYLHFSSSRAIPQISYRAPSTSNENFIEHGNYCGHLKPQYIGSENTNIILRVYNNSDGMFLTLDMLKRKTRWVKIQLIIYYIRMYFNPYNFFLVEFI